MKNKPFLLLPIFGIVLLISSIAFSQTRQDPKTVLFRVSVANKKENIVSGLKEEQFSVKENGAEQKISYFSNAEEAASVMILLDFSKSVEPGTKNLNIRLALKFIAESNPQNEYSIIGFHTNVIELADWKDGKDQVDEKVKKMSDPKTSGGNTRFYDAILAAFEKFNTAKHDKKVLLIFSDGQDNESEEDFGKVKNALKRNDIAVYGMSLLSASDGYTMTGMQAAVYLDEMSIISGGRTYFPKTVEESVELLQKIIAAVKNTYVIGYVPTESKEKKDWHSVKIKASTVDAKGKEKSLLVRTREGYFGDEEKPE